MTKDTYTKILQSSRAGAMSSRVIKNISNKYGHVTGARKPSKKTILELYRDGKGISVELAIKAGAVKKDHSACWESYKRQNKEDVWVKELAKACSIRGLDLTLNIGNKK